jgi:hypothetical protein
LLVFVGIPAAVVVVVYGAVYGTSGRRSSKRYRPGRPFSFAPVWFLAAPEKVVDSGTSPAELTAAEHKAPLPAGPLLAQQGAAQQGQEQVAQRGETGGASDSW